MVPAHQRQSRDNQLHHRNNPEIGEPADQPRDSEGARPRGAPTRPRPRRRGDRV